jgi:phage-related protein
VIPITDYDLGKARGRIVIEYDDRGAQEAEESFSHLEELAEDLISVFERLAHASGVLTNTFGDNARRFAGAFGLMAGGAAVLMGLSRATGVFTGSVFKMRGVLGILGSLGLLLGGVPKSIEGFPKVIKQIVLLSAAIGVFAKSTKLLNGVIVQIGKFIASTAIIQKLSAAFPRLIGMLGQVTKFIPSIATVGKTIDGWGKPIHQIARMALLLGGLITLFRNGTKAALSLTKTILKLGAGAIVIQTLVTLVAGLGDAAVQASGLLGLIPGAIATIGIAAATVRIGMQGFADALKNMGDAQKFEESLKNLAPSAARTARAIKDLSDDWERLRRSVQQQLFMGAADEIRDLGRIWLPILQDRLSRVASILNSAAKEVANFFKQASTIEDVNLIFDAIDQSLENLSGLIQPVLSILMDIFVVSSQVFSEMTGQLNGAALAFADFIHEARESGALAQWIRDGVEALKSMVKIIWNIGSIFNTVFDAFDSNSDGFLKSIELMTERIKAFLTSAEGQEILNTFVDLLQTLSSVTKAVLGAGLSELGPIIKALLPFLKEMAETISAVLVVAIKILGPILRGVAEVLSFLAPVLGPLIGFFLAWSIVMGALSIGIGVAITVIGTLVTAIASVIRVVRVLTLVLMANPIIAIITAIALIAWLIYDNWEVIGPKLKAIWDWIANTAKSIWNGIRDFFVGLWTTIRDFFVDTWNGIVDKAKRIWGAISDFFENLWDDISGYFVKIWDDIASSAEEIWTWIVDTFRFIWEPLVDIAKSIFSIVVDLFVIIFGGLAIVAIAIWDAIVAGVKDAWNTITSFLTLAWNAIKTAFHAVWDPIAEFFSWIWGKVTEEVQTAWDTITSFLSIAWDAISTAFHAIWDPIAEFFTTFWNVISQAAQMAWGEITGFLTEAWNTISSIASDIWNGIANFFRDIWNSKIVTAVRDGVGNVVDWIRGLPGRIWEIVKDAGKWLWDAGKKVITGFLDGLKNAFRAVRDWIGGIADWVRDNKGPPEKDAKLLIPAGEAIMTGFLQGLQSKEMVIQRFLESFAVDIERGIGGVTSAMNTASNLSASSTLGIVASLPSNAETLASGVTPVPVGANGVSGATGNGSAAPAMVHIAQLDLHVAGNLDPTKPVEWRNAMKEIQEGLRKVGRDYPSNG